MLFTHEVYRLQSRCDPRHAELSGLRQRVVLVLPSAGDYFSRGELFEVEEGEDERDSEDEHCEDFAEQAVLRGQHIVVVSFELVDALVHLSSDVLL